MVYTKTGLVDVAARGVPAESRIATVAAGESRRLATTSFRSSLQALLLQQLPPLRRLHEACSLNRGSQR